MKKVNLSKQEIDTLKILATWRANGKTNLASANLWSPGSDKKSKSLEGHYLGVVGEYVVAKLTNGFFDPIPRMAGDKHSADIVSGFDQSAVRISVKTTRYDPPIFKLNGLHEIKDATHCCLCLYKEPTVTVYWIVSKSKFLDKMYRQDFGYGERLCLGATIE